MLGFGLAFLLLSFSVFKVVLMFFEWIPFVLPLALFVATFGLIVDNLFNIDDAIFAGGFTVVVLVGISVRIVVVGVIVGVGRVVVGCCSSSNNVVLLPLLLTIAFDTLGIGLTAFDVTFSL